MKNVTVDEYSDITVTCGINGNIKWFLNCATVPISLGYKTSSNSFTFMSVQRSVSGQRITCGNSTYNSTACLLVNSGKCGWD